MRGQPPRRGDRTISADWARQVERNRRATASGTSFPGFGTAQRVTCLLVRKPVTADKRLTIRRVKYKEMPPIECAGTTCYYDFASPEVEVYPDYGKKVMDYEGDEWTKATIDDDAVFMKAYVEDGVWRVEKPPSAAAEIDYCVILQTSGAGSPSGVSPANDPTLGAFRLRVQRVHLNDVGVWVSKGSPLVTSTRPNCPGSLYDDYRRFSRNGTFSGLPTSETWSWSAHANMITFQVMKTDGIWVCEQPPPMVTRQFPSGTAAGCSTV